MCVSAPHHRVRGAHTSCLCVCVCVYMYMQRASVCVPRHRVHDTHTCVCVCVCVYRECVYMRLGVRAGGSQGRRELQAASDNELVTERCAIRRN